MDIHYIYMLLFHVCNAEHVALAGRLGPTPVHVNVYACLVVGPIEAIQSVGPASQQVGQPAEAGGQ